MRDIEPRISEEEWKPPVSMPFFTNDTISINQDVVHMARLARRRFPALWLAGTPQLPSQPALPCREEPRARDAALCAQPGLTPAPRARRSRTRATRRSATSLSSPSRRSPSTSTRTGRRATTPSARTRTRSSTTPSRSARRGGTADTPRREGMTRTCAASARRRRSRRRRRPRRGSSERRGVARGGRARMTIMHAPR